MMIIKYVYFEARIFMSGSGYRIFFHVKYDLIMQELIFRSATVDYNLYLGWFPLFFWGFLLFFFYLLLITSLKFFKKYFFYKMRNYLQSKKRC